MGGGLPRDRRGMRVLERIDESVEAVEELLAARRRRVNCRAYRFHGVTSTAIVTGGAGFIGSHVVDALLARGLRGDGDRRSLLGQRRVGWPTRRSCASWTSSTSAALDARRRRRSRPRAIFHLAAQASVVARWRIPGATARSTCKGTLNVVEAAGSCGASVVFTSTGGALYGDEAPRPTREDRIPAPLSPYGASKWAAEAYVKTWSLSSGIPHAVCRLGNVYGPRQSPHGEAGVVAIFAHHLYTGRAPEALRARQADTRLRLRGATSSARCWPRGQVGHVQRRHGRGDRRDDRLERAAARSAGARTLEPELADLRPGELKHSCLDTGAGRA